MTFRIDRGEHVVKGGCWIDGMRVSPLSIWTALGDRGGSALLIRPAGVYSLAKWVCISHGKFSRVTNLVDAAKGVTARLVLSRARLSYVAFSLFA